MKRTALTLTLIVAFLTSVIAGTQLSNLGEANMVPITIVSPDANTEPPTVKITSPKNNAVYNIENLALPFNVSLGYSSTALGTWIKDVFYKADWQPNNTSVSSLAFSTTLNLTRISEGKHSAVVVATERGKYNSPSSMSDPVITFDKIGVSSVSFTIDTTPPSISVLSLENKTYHTSDIPLNFIVNEPVSQITYSLDGQKNVTIAGNTTLTELSNGLHNITVYAKDVAGNIGTSETIYFIVKVPFPTTLVAAAVVSVAVISIGLLVYFKKRKR